MQRHGWVLLFHEFIVEQLQKLRAAARRAERNDPKGFERNANVKLFRALSQLILETVPSDPARDEYRQGNTLEPAYRHWRRAKVGRRFRLFASKRTARIGIARIAAVGIATTLFRRPRRHGEAGRRAGAQDDKRQHRDENP